MAALSHDTDDGGELSSWGFVDALIRAVLVPHAGSVA
jgi:hypothetical protein